MASFAGLVRRSGTPTARAFAEETGCSTALVSAIRNGVRDLDPTKVSAWSRALRLDEDETRYFVALVDLESSSRMRRDAAQAYVRAVQRFRSADRIDDERLDVFVNWYYAAILELAHCESFRPDPEWIADRLSPPVTAAQAAEALEKLRATGLLFERDGALVPIPVLVTSPEIPPGKVSAAIREFYLGTFDRAGQALYELAPSERHLTSLMVSLPRSALPWLKRRMTEVEQELVAYCAEQPARERVYQLACLLFPVSRSTHDQDDR